MGNSLKYDCTVVKSYLSLVAMAAQSIIRAARPTRNPTMMIQSRGMGEKVLDDGISFVIVVVIISMFPDLPGVLCPLWISDALPGSRPIMGCEPK